MATHFGRGPRSNASKMSKAQRVDYDAKRKWLQQQHGISALYHGWQTHIAQELGVSTTLVNQVLHGHHISPDVLEGMHTYAMRILGRAVPDDVFSRVENAEGIMEHWGEQVTSLREQLQALEEQQAAEQERFTIRWWQRTSKVEAALAEAEREHDRAIKAWEQLEIQKSEAEEVMQFGEDRVPPEVQEPEAAAE